MLLPGPKPLRFVRSPVVEGFGYPANGSACWGWPVRRPRKLLPTFAGGQVPEADPLTSIAQLPVQLTFHCEVGVEFVAAGVPPVALEFTSTPPPFRLMWAFDPTTSAFGVAFRSRAIMA